VRPLAILIAGLLAVSPAGGRRQAQTSKSDLTAKVGADLVMLSEEYKSYIARGAGATFKPSNPLLRIVDDRVVIDAVAVADTQTLQADLQTLGMQRAVAFGRVVSGQLPIAAIDALSTVASLLAVQPAYGSTQTDR